MKKIKLLFLILIAGVVSTACSNQAEEKGTVVVNTTYTCPMHPQIVQAKQGTCPICGMDLVVFDRTNKDKSLTLHDSQIALANITTMIVGDTSL